MRADESNITKRKATNLSLDANLRAQAKAFDTNISRSAELGIYSAVKKAQEAAWLRANKDALESSNQYVESHGLPLQKHRQF